MCKSGNLLFRFGGVRGLHYDLDEVVLGKDFLQDALDLLLAEGVDCGFVVRIHVTAVDFVGLDGALPVGVGLPALRDVLLEVQDSAGQFFVGRTVLGQVLEALDGEVAELVAHRRAAVEADLEEGRLHRAAAEARVAFVLAP